MMPTVTRDLRNDALAALGGSLMKWKHQCHAASYALVKAGVADRVARGWCLGVGGQHSWAVIGMDCYDKKATIIDPTLWSYDSTVMGIWMGTMRDGRHQPHGYGHFSMHEMPMYHGGEVVNLTPRKPLSKEARKFLDSIGPLDHPGWAQLAKFPVGGWPAAEIIDAMVNTEGLKVFVPIDIVGMLTDRNPGGIYLREAKR